MTARSPFVSAGAALRNGPAKETWSEPFPPRGGCAVVPLIEAADMYPALERLVLGAERSVWLAFRIFDPDTRLRSDEAAALGLGSWADLIGHALERGIEVRLLLADFEPVMADELHAGSWASFARLTKLRDEVGAAAERLQLVVIQHEGEIGWAWRQLLRLPLSMKIRKRVSALLADGEPARDVGIRPGLWRYLEWSGEAPRRFRRGPPPRLWPATYHQKFVVVDHGRPGATAIVGGLDLDERRWDDRRHRQRADQTWHDISSRVTGPAVADVAAHFVQCWNRELPRFREITAEWRPDDAPPLSPEPLAEIAPAEADAQPSSGAATVQIVRTRSRRSGSPLAFGPVPHVRELKAAHRNLILSARRRLYIEAQFFRSKDAARWVEQALKATPALEVILLTANAPEEVAFEGAADNPAHRHGEYLQARAIRRLLRSGGRDRVGAFMLAKQERVRGDEAQFVEQRGTAFSSGLIHIHAKLVIADDDACLLSSANINGRSFEWDTELGLVWHEEGAAIAAFRDRLWRDLSDGALGAGASLAEWRALARDNALAAPETRRGFVLPYQLRRARRFARPVWFVPDDLV